MEEGGNTSTPMLRQRLARGMSYEEEDTCMSYKHLDSYVAAAAGTWSQVLGCYYAHLEEVEKRVVPPFRKRPEDLYVHMCVYNLHICIYNVHTYIPTWTRTRAITRTPA